MVNFSVPMSAFAGHSAGVPGPLWAAIDARRSIIATMALTSSSSTKNSHFPGLHPRGAFFPGLTPRSLDPAEPPSALAGPRTLQVDLEDRTVVPGFIDAHAHPASAGRSHLRRVDCDLRSIVAIRDAIRDRARTAAGQWVLGFKYDDTKTEEGRPLTRQDLDTAAGRDGPKMRSLVPSACRRFQPCTEAIPCDSPISARAILHSCARS